MLELKSTFNGLFEPNCQIESIPTSLLALVNLILYGPSIQTQASSYAKSQAGLSISAAIALYVGGMQIVNENAIRQERHHFQSTLG